MRKIAKILISGILVWLFVSASVVWSATLAEQKALAAVKFFIDKAQERKWEDPATYYHLYRWFQYTCMTLAKNPASYILSNEGRSELKSTGLSLKDKGKYLLILGDRSANRVRFLWENTKGEIFTKLSKDDYERNFRQTVTQYIDARELPEFKKHMALIGTGFPGSGDHIDFWIGNKIDMGTNFPASLSFWYRRTLEKNDEVTYEILKEIQNHYGK